MAKCKTNTHGWSPVGKGDILLSRAGFVAPGVWGLSKLLLSKAGCAHIKVAQCKSWGGRKKFFGALIIKFNFFLPLSHPTFISIVVILVQSYSYLDINK